MSEMTWFSHLRFCRVQERVNAIHTPARQRNSQHQRDLAKTEQERRKSWKRRMRHPEQVEDARARAAAKRAANPQAANAKARQYKVERVARQGRGERNGKGYRAKWRT